MSAPVPHTLRMSPGRAGRLTGIGLVDVALLALCLGLLLRLAGPPPVSPGEAPPQVSRPPFAALVSLPLLIWTEDGLNLDGAAIAPEAARQALAAPGAPGAVRVMAPAGQGAGAVLAGLAGILPEGTRVYLVTEPVTAGAP